MSPAVYHFMVALISIGIPIGVAVLVTWLGCGRSFNPPPADE